MQIRLLLLTIFVTICMKVHADLTCDGDVCSFLRPLQSNSGQSQLVKYSFQYRKAVPGFPTIVIVPGGPGSRSTFKEKDWRVLSQIPKEFGLMQTDPLFIGVNSSFNVNVDENQFTNVMTSEQVAADIRSALELMAPEKIIVYGMSYGTIPATILASQVSASALVLDGTWSRTFSQSEYNASFFKQWDLVGKRLGAAAVDRFIQKTKEMQSPYASHMFGDRVTPSRLGDAITVAAMTGKLDQLIADPAEFKIILLSDAYDHSRNLFRDNISCREMTPDGPIGSIFYFDDSLKEEPSDCPKNLSRHKIDAKNYPVKLPIIYLSGEDDPAAAPWMARDHMEKQALAKKWLVSVPHGSHMSLERDLARCASEFWSGFRDSPEAAVGKLAPCLASQR